MQQEHCFSDSTSIKEQTLNANGGVLDIAFSPQRRSKHDYNDTVTALLFYRKLAVALSDGRVDFYDFPHVSGRCVDNSSGLVNHQSHQLFHGDILVLDIVWHPIKDECFAVTLSTGEVMMCSLGLDGAHTHTQTTHLFTHGLEAWTTAYCSSGCFVYSGGDDCVLACHSLDDAVDATLWKDNKIHGAGVTAILPILANPVEQGNELEEILLTGSYDDHIRVIAVTQSRGKKPRMLAELNLGGGVWRLAIIQAPTLQPHTSISTCHNTVSLRWLILASCMYAGVRIVEIRRYDAGWDINIVLRFEEHKSVNYGSAARPKCAGDSNRLEIVSTSFYDKLLCLWSFDRCALLET